MKCTWCGGALKVEMAVEGMHEACKTFGRDLDTAKIGYIKPGSHYSTPSEGYFEMTNAERREAYHLIDPFNEVDLGGLLGFETFSCKLDHRVTPHDCVGGK